jgi:hypothetical protein
MTRRAARPPITGWPSLLCSQARLEGYRAALERAGAPAGPSLVYSGDVHFDAAPVAAPAAWTEAVCPACVGVSLLAERVPGLAGLARLDPVDPGRPAGPGGPEPGDEPKVLVR